jgi:hypothetical protein
MTRIECKPARCPQKRQFAVTVPIPAMALASDHTLNASMQTFNGINFISAKRDPSGENHAKPEDAEIAQKLLGSPALQMPFGPKEYEARKRRGDRDHE